MGEDKLAFKDSGLLCADKAYLRKRNVQTGDVILLSDKLGGQFVQAACGPARGLYFLSQTMEKVASHPWGSRRKPSGQKRRWKPQAEIEITVAAWWCFVGSDVCCLH